MRTTLKQIGKHAGTIYGKDTINELHNRKVVIVEKPQHTKAVLEHHQYMVAIRENIFMCLQAARAFKKKLLIGKKLQNMLMQRLY